MGEELTDMARIIRVPCGPDTFVVKEELSLLIPEWVERLRATMKAEGLRYDVIHSHYWDGGYAGMLLKRKLRVPHIFTPHSLGKWKEQALSREEVAPHDLSRVYHYRERIEMEKRIMRAADTTLMLSQAQWIKLLQHYAVDFERIRVLYPGVDTRVFRPGKNGKNNGFPTKNNILLVSRFVPAKGIDRAIELLRRLSEAVDCHLYIITAQSSEYASPEEVDAELTTKNLIQAYGLQDRVTFLGFVSNRKKLAAYYRQTDLFLQPARYEPFGLTTMEAMASGTVALISHVAGSTELNVDGVNGFIVNIHHEQQVVDLMADLLRDKKHRKRVSENAVVTIQRHFSWDVIATNLINTIYPAQAVAA
jgi:mannosylfructose-phosphate synthase